MFVRQIPGMPSPSSRVRDRRLSRACRDARGRRTPSCRRRLRAAPARITSFTMCQMSRSRYSIRGDVPVVPVDVHRVGVEDVAHVGRRSTAARRSASASARRVLDEVAAHQAGSGRGGRGLELVVQRPVERLVLARSVDELAGVRLVPASCPAHVRRAVDPAPDPRARRRTSLMSATGVEPARSPRSGRLMLIVAPPPAQARTVLTNDA